MKIIGRDLGFPEGPVVMPDGAVAFVEMRLGLISKVTPAGEKVVVARPGGGPNGLALGPGGLLYVCNNGGTTWRQRDGEWTALGHGGPEYTGGRIETVDPASGEVRVLYDACEGRRLSAPNDIVFGADGGFWFTDPGAVRRDNRDHGAVYWAKPDGSEIRRVLNRLNRPNGIGLSPDGRRLYVADTQTTRLYAWDVAGPGELVKRDTPAAYGAFVIGGVADESRFDSLKVTASGKICVATTGNGGIAEFWPDGGTCRRHQLPDAHATNLAFGGPDLRTAYVTLSGEGWLAAIPWHEPGLRLHFN
ncbi:MAG: SMP-30/gluconolactonase/LRE family protein [Caulobacteraceae bacterium]|nr:SMP-30/gluconolactonase/LRE family protein [Caulobacteraceae bacterium]